MNRFRWAGAPFAFLAIGTIAWFWLIGRKSGLAWGFDGYDLYRYVYPTWLYLGDQLAEGRFPLWNPYQLAGQPFVAFQFPTSFYPPTLAILSLTSAVRAFEIQFVLHFALAAWFTWKFAAQIGLGPIARAAASLCYAMSTPMLYSGLYFPPYQLTQAWLPAILWAVHGLVREPGPRWSIALGGFVALAYLASHSQGLVYMLYLAGTYGLFALFAYGDTGGRLRTIGWACFAGMLAAGLSAPQLLPAFELASVATRSFGGQDLPADSLGSVSPGHVLKGLAGWPAPQADSPVSAFSHWRVALPTLFLPLMACGWFVREQRGLWVLLLATAATIGTIMMGSNTPFFAVYTMLPAVDWFRFVNRWDFAYGFVCTVVLAMGIEGLLRILAAKRVDRRIAAGIASTLVVLTAGQLLTRVEPRAIHPAIRDPGRGAPTEVLELLKSDLGYHRVFVAPTGRALHTAMPVKLGSMNRLFTIPDYEPLIASDYARYFGAKSPKWHGQVNLLDELQDEGRKWKLARLLEAMSTRYYLLESSNRRDMSKLTFFTVSKPRRVGGIAVYERSNPLPRAYAVARVWLEEDTELAIDRMVELRFDPRREASVVAPIGDRERFQGLQLDGRAPARPAGTVTIERYASEEIELEAHCVVECLVVLTDFDYPGWRVSVDGFERPVERVNGLFRGVVVNAERHRIVYRFQPRSLRWGLAAAGSSLLAIVAVTVGTKRSRRARA